MNFLQAILLAIVEGITEFLPISSTGHLVLTAEILKIPQTDFVKSFEIIIQLGAICAVIFLYWRMILKNVSLWKKLLIAFLPTAVIGLTLYKAVKDILLGNPTITLIALFFGGIVLIILEYIYREKDHHAKTVNDITLKQAFFIGLFQSISIVPGVSRAAATILGGLFMGAKRQAAVEFSFLLAIPTMLAASGLDLLKTHTSFTSNELVLLIIGFVGSFFVALLAVKFLLQFIQNHTFIPFGIYRIILAIVFWLVIIPK